MKDKVKVSLEPEDKRLIESMIRGDTPADVKTPEEALLWSLRAVHTLFRIRNEILKLFGTRPRDPSETRVFLQTLFQTPWEAEGVPIGIGETSLKKVEDVLDLLGVHGLDVSPMSTVNLVRNLFQDASESQRELLFELCARQARHETTTVESIKLEYSSDDIHQLVQMGLTKETEDGILIVHDGIANLIAS